MPCSRTPTRQTSADHLALAHDDVRRVKGVVPRIETFEALSLQLSLTACCLDPPVLDLWDYSRRPKVLFPVAGLPCRSGLHTRRNLRPCPDALTRYFNAQAFEPHAVTKYEHYAQRTMIAELFDYRVWSADFLPPLTQQAAQIVRRDVTPGFIVAELIAYLNEHKIGPIRAKLS